MTVVTSFYLFTRLDRDTSASKDSSGIHSERLFVDDEFNENSRTIRSAHLHVDPSVRNPCRRNSTGGIRFHYSIHSIESRWLSSTSCDSPSRQCFMEQWSSISRSSHSSETRRSTSCSIHQQVTWSIDSDPFSRSPHVGESVGRWLSAHHSMSHRSLRNAHRGIQCDTNRNVLVSFSSRSTILGWIGWSNYSRSWSSRTQIWLWNERLCDYVTGMLPR